MNTTVRGFLSQRGAGGARAFPLLVRLAAVVAVAACAGCRVSRLDRANRLLQSGDYLSARRMYLEAIERRPGDFNAHYGAGMSWCAEALYKTELSIVRPDDWYRALYHMTVASGLAPQKSEVRRTLAAFHFNLGTCHRNEGDIDAAIGRLEQAVACDSSLIKAYNLLGVLYQEKGDFAAARKCYSRVLEVQPDYTKAHFNLGALEWACGDYCAAAGHFQRAVDIEPGNSHFSGWLEKARQRAECN
jgi:tetratricopeptide (TPR) repeat protein